MAGPKGSSVGATCNLFITACMAEGETVLTEAACEPEVVQLGEMLQAMGADIDGLGTPTVRIRGGRPLHGVDLAIIPDRIEAATFLIAGAITDGDLVVRGTRPDHMTAVIEALAATGVEVSDLGGGDLRVRRAGPLRAHNILTDVYPAFPTDVQAPFMALLTLCEGESQVEEKIYTDRFMHVPELRRLGADIRQDGPRVTIRGVSHLSGAPIMASDLRCGAALVLAALAAEGKTDILRVYHIDRGYEKIEAKLHQAGGRIWRRSDEEPIAEGEVDMPPEFPPELGFMPNAFPVG
jgi:UDP-N-acetylglucosamine 1-carboxyvinyltransferase